MKDTSEYLLHLLRLSLGNESVGQLTNSVDWNALMDLSFNQGVSTIAFDGLQSSGIDIPEETKYEWLGQQLQQESEYDIYRKAISELAKFYANQGIKMMLLKGYGLSLNWPLPNHRPVGDIDVYFFGLWDFADQIVEKKLGIKVDRTHHHHTVFSFNGFSVENHYDFINVAAHKESAAIEKRLKELAEESIETQIDGVKFFLPSANFNAIFLIRHAGAHFAGEKITLRQLLDWGLFIDKHTEDVDWETVLPFIREMGCWRFFCALNGICIDELGISAKKIPAFDRDLQLEQRVLNDILQPKFVASGNGTFFRLCRWCANVWKHRIVYREPLVPMFVRLAWSHLKGPVIG